MSNQSYDCSSTLDAYLFIEVYARIDARYIIIFTSDVAHGDALICILFEVCLENGSLSKRSVALLLWLCDSFVC